METHVFAVWDFMSLLKRLQLELTCTSTPWIPVGNPITRRLINEIVFGEESDVDQNGQALSHFELYLQAMEDIGADTRAINSYIKQLKQGESWEKALVNSGASHAAIQFVHNTMDFVEHAPIHVVAGVFTYWREDLIPDMFTSIVKEYNAESRLNKFVYYLERHIELDGGEHGPLALELISNLCGDDNQKWEEVEETAVNCLIARKKLWDAVLSKLTSSRIHAF